MACFPDTVEEIDSSLPPPKCKSLPLAAFCDSNLAYYRVTRRSTFGATGMVGKTATTHKPKRHASPEVPVRGTKLNIGRVGVEYCQEIHCMLRNIGVESNTPTKCYGYNKSVLETCSNENAECKSRHSIISFHKIRESVATGIIAPHHACSKETIADILSKSIGIEMHNNLTNRI